jgi:hemerythrin superfamily protein
MNAIQLLKSDHKNIEELFREYERTNGRKNNKRTVVQRIVKELNAHATIEEQIFYPAAAKYAPETRRVVLKAMEEHHMTKLEIAELEQMSPEDERWEAKVLFVIDMTRIHIAEEENVLFPVLREKMPRKLLDQLGEQIQRAKRRVPREVSTALPRLPRATRSVNGEAVLSRAQQAIQAVEARLRSRKGRVRERGASA